MCIIYNAIFGHEIQGCNKNKCKTNMKTTIGIDISKYSVDIRNFILQYFFEIYSNYMIGSIFLMFHLIYAKSDNNSFVELDIQKLTH